MADTDVFGILSLLLAAGGVLYLFRARILSRTEVAQGSSDGAQRDGRSSATLPPKLRPKSEIPPAKARKDAPSTDAERKADPTAE